MVDEQWEYTYIEGISVSTMGRVKRDKDGYLFKIKTNKSNGYNYVDLRRYKKGTMMKVSRLVALTFLQNPENKSDVDHINTIKTDDRLENLRWATRKENMNNETTKLKIKARGFIERPYSRKAILQYSKNDEFIQEWDSATSFGKFIGKNVSGNIKACIIGRQKTAYGFKWKSKYD